MGTILGQPLGYALATFAIALVLCSALCYAFVWLWRSASRRVDERRAAKLLERAPKNPVLRPDIHAWEEGGTFNPAAVKTEGGTHIFYRAVGSDGVSRVGYARSENGVTLDERLPFPVFAIDHPVARRRRRPLNPRLVASGGSWAGGAEDPRAVVLEGRLYLSFSAFGGWDSVRMGVASLSLEDLERKRWRWSTPVFLSHPTAVHKNWVIFPERIGGKVAVLHSLHSGSRDRVVVDYLDTIDEEPPEFIESPYAPVADPSRWDAALRGAAAPPIKTDRGWLLLYHATSAGEGHRYKVGAMLLDLDDPTRVVGRMSEPLLVPDAHYENNGAKSGVVYACGATVEGETLRVYYGAADSWSCVAQASLPAVLAAMA